MPQIENAVRWRFKEAGVDTISIKDGIDQEAGLCALLKKKETKGILDKNIADELNMLFCNDGYNLRNNLAHGLMDDNVFCENYIIIYAWWFCLRLILVAPDLTAKS